MKKIIVRSGMTPFEKKTATDMLMRNIMGGNIGNLVYANSIYRAVMSEEVEVDSDHYMLEQPMSGEKIDEVNQTYSMYLIPLADAFRLNFGIKLHIMAQNIKKLRIPVVVIGVGVRNELENANDYSSLDPIKKDAIEFVKEVLNHSSVVGTRGVATYEYLLSLGFSDKEIEPIGCPSMYTFGPNLDLKPLELTPESQILVNNTPDTTDNVHKFMRKVQRDYPNYTFIPQREGELRELFVGAPFRKKPISSKPLYPFTIDDPVFSEGRARFFLSAASWIDFASEKALSIGPRLHGGVAPLISGIPSVIIAKDVRMKELVDFHKLPHVERDRVDENTELTDVLASVDFDSVQKNQPENFRHYIDFLNENGVPNIYSGETEPVRGQTAYDRKMAETKLLPPVTPITSCSTDEMAARWYDYFPRLDKKNGKAKSGGKDSGKAGSSAKEVKKEANRTFGSRLKAAAKVIMDK